MVGTTIPHEVRYKWGAAKILLKPAAPGTGVISGGAMRAVIELAGIRDILTKSLGTNNPINTVRATMLALQSLRSAQEVAELRGKQVEEIVGPKLAAAYRQAAARGSIQDVGGAGAATAPVGAPTPADAAAAARPPREQRQGGAATAVAEPPAAPAPAPAPPAAAPEPPAPAPEPQAPASEPQAQAPEPPAPAPEPQATAPEPPAQAPEPPAQAPEPSAAPPPASEEKPS